MYKHDFINERMIIMSKKVRIIALAMVVMTLLSVMAVDAMAASWVTGNFPGNAYVRLDKSNKEGKIKIHTYNCTKGNHSGKCFGSGETNGKIKVTIYTTNGRYISSKNVQAKATVKLPKGNDAYRVNIVCRQDLGSSIWGQGDNTINLGKCVHWAVETVSNVHF